MFGVFGGLEINLLDFEQGKITITFFRWTDFTRNGVASMEAETPYLTGRNVNVVRPRKVRPIGRTQKAKTIRQYFQYPIPKYVLTALRLFFKDGENQILLAAAGHSLDL